MRQATSHRTQRAGAARVLKGFSETRPRGYTVHRSGKINKFKPLRVATIETIGVRQVETLLMEGEVSIVHMAEGITDCQNLHFSAVQ